MKYPLREPDQDVRRSARTALERDGYVVVRDQDLGLGLFHRRQIRAAYFNDQVLRRYPNDIPADRLRARDVIRYDWVDNEVKLTEHGAIAIEGRGGHPGRRDFDRVEVLYDSILEHWIRGVLLLVPERSRQGCGTLGINFFRTFTDVVTKPHQDGEEYIIVYVVDKIGGGARTQLFELDAKDCHFEDELKPGDLIIFRDDRFQHSATPLLAIEGEPARRDAMVCTINYPGTYDLS